MNEGEVRAQFRLLGDNVKNDIDAIKGRIAGQVKDSGKGTPLAQVNRDLEANIAFGRGGGGGMSKVSSKMLAAMSPEDRAFVLRRSGIGSSYRGLRETGGKDLARINAMGAFGTPFKGLREVGGGDLAKVAAMGEFGASSGKPPPNFWGMFSKKMGGKVQSAAGLSGTGASLAVAGGVAAVLITFAVAIKALSKVMHESISAYKDAPKLYAKALTTGLGLKLVSKRSMLADIMGVSMEDVMRYGAAFQYLNPKIEWASTIMARTNQNLTSVGWSFKIVGENFNAMFATIADKMAPAMRTFASATSEWIQLVTNFISSPAFKAITIYPRMVAKVEGFGLRTWFKLLSGGNSMNLKDPGAAPPPQSFMKQLPVSAWEKMGLMVGGGGSSTNDLIRQGNDYLKRIANAVSPRNGVPRGNQFDLNPIASNP